MMDREWFTAKIAEVELGDIKWLPTQPGHNVEFVAGPDE